MGEPARLGPLSTRDVALALEGKQLDHFRLEKLIGGGGMGAVFRGIDLKLGRTVAIKILSRDQHDPETQRRFKNEAQSAARLDHENIARVYFVGEAEGWNYIVFEYVQGINLREMVEEKGPLPLAEAISYTVQVAEALRHAHQRDVVHRDIKPSNVLVAAQGKVKVVDMGLARLHQVESPENDLTASGVTLGTFDYISPEQARDPRSADVRSDMYSLGCTLYFMLSGRPPFPGGTVLQKLLSHTSDPPPDLRQFRPDLPDELAVVVERLLAKSPERRYALPGDLVDDLSEVCEQIGIDLPTVTTPQRATPAAEPPAWERHLPWIVPCGVLILAVVGLDGLFPSSAPPTTRIPRFAVAPARAGENPPVPVAPGPAPVAPVAERPMPPTPPSEAENGGAKGAETKGSEAPRPSPMRTSPMRTTPMRTTESPVVENLGENPAGPMVVAPVSPGSPSEVPPRDPSMAIAGMNDPVTPMPGEGTEEKPPVPPIMPMMSRVAEGVRPAPVKRTLIVGDPGQADGFLRFGDLSSAISAIERGPRGAAAGETTIELQYNGPRVSGPMVLQDLNITLRKGAEFHPIVVFRPTAAEVRSQAMISISGGRLEAQDLPFELQLPRGPIEGGSLFAIQKAEQVKFFNCTLTIDGSQGIRSVGGTEPAFFELLATPRLEGNQPPDMVAMMEESSVPLDLYHTVVRGPATFIRAAEAVPLTLYWMNGLLATSERFLVMGGSKHGNRLGGHLNIELRHVTAAAGKGLFLISPTSAAKKPFSIDAKLNDNIFLIGPDSPLIEQRGFEPIEAIRERLVISGKGNFYQAGFSQPMEVFWRLVSLEPKEQTVDMDFEQWDKHWPGEMLPQRRLVLWLQPPTVSVPWHRQSKSDYLLSPERKNPARAPGDGDSDAGFDAKLLPESPSIDVEPLSPELREGVSALPPRR